MALPTTMGGVLLHQLPIRKIPKKMVTVWLEGQFWTTVREGRSPSKKAMTIKMVQETQGDERGSLNYGMSVKFPSMWNKGVFCGS